MPLARTLGRLVPLALAFLLPLGCDEPVPDDAGRSADPEADGHDECTERGWYGDGVCDSGCAEPDPDCGAEECQDACADVCDAVWSGATPPGMPAGCGEASCECGEAPIECPDVCEAECNGAARPDVPEGCPDYECNCEDVLPGPEAPDEGPSVQLADVPRCSMEPDAGSRRAVRDADRRDATRATVATAASRRTIDVVVHVVRATNDAGDVPRSWIIRQMSVMNRAYRRSPFKFRLSKITRTTNDKWFRMDKDTAEERDAKNKLHTGKLATMNVYVTGTKELLGWAVFPDEARQKGKQDGIVVNYGTLPGGTNRPYHLGDTLVHEAGHWFGLYHTFGDDTCVDNDDVSDTPAENGPAHGCPTGRDTCRGGGKDPIHNYMDYGNDACLTEFTPGQRRLMGQRTGRYRPVGARDDAPEDFCGNNQCDGGETHRSCPMDCGCAATESCSGVAPGGCYCDADCAEEGDCCSDADTCE